MKQETLKKIKQNSVFFIIVVGAIAFFLIVSLLISKNFKSVEEISDLPESGSVNSAFLIINELQTSNNGTYADEKGASYDWVELYNGSSKDKTLDNYSLSDDQNKIKWAFPSGTVIKSKSYLVVFLSGTKEDGLYTNFKLKSSGGETLVLRNSNKKIIDAVETVSMDKNRVMIRQGDGSFAVSQIATPGYENSKEGFKEFTANIKTTEEKELVISEILPNNKGHFKDAFGEYSGYIEITNVSGGLVNLKGYSVSNNISTPYKWALPDISLGNNEAIVIYTSNRNVYENEYHANFKLNNRNGEVILAKNNLIEDKVTYDGIANGMAYIKGENSYYVSNMISPGYSNDESGVKSFQNKFLTKNSGLIINEAMNLNYSLLVQNGNNYYDWIELYNNTNDTIKLSDYYLTTSMDNPKSYKLPEVELKSHEYYILMASGDTNLSNNSYEHANFKLSESEGIFLYKGSKVVDSIFIASVPTGYSMGRADSGFNYYSNPTPGSKNNSGTMQISYVPIFSSAPGVYNDVESVTVEIFGEGTVYYTTDGSIPSARSKVYSEPLVLTSTRVIKAVSLQSGRKMSEVVTSSYIINENHTLPVMSVSLNPSDFTSISRNAWTVDYEKEAYAEFFEDGNSFKIPAGLKLFGGSTRGHSKKSFSINFRKKYGQGELNYQVFDNRDNAVYNSLVLRTGSQDEQSAVIRDMLGTSLVDGMINVDVQAYKSIILYINGKYWGTYWLRERVDEDFIESHYNVEGEGTDIIRIDGEVKSGSSANYRSLISYIKSHDLSKKEYYDYVASKVDIDSVIDFWVAETYVTNNDIVNCRFFSNPNVEDGKWKFIFYDLDYAFYNYFLNYYKFSTSSSGMTGNYYSTDLLRNLMKNSEFKEKYIERVAYQLKEVWNKERVMKKFNELVDELTPEMERNFSRWGGSMKHWKSELDELSSYIDKRESYMKSQAKSYFGLSDAQMKEYFGG